jgi:hypothetical protein
VIASTSNSRFSRDWKNGRSRSASADFLYLG